MPTTLNILPPNQAQSFDSPPKFSNAERQIHFRVPVEAKEYLQSLRSETSKASFVIQLGYFRARGRFFDSKMTYTRDLKYVITYFGLRSLKSESTGKGAEKLKEKLGGARSTRHRQEILRIERWSEMTKGNRRQLDQHGEWQAQKRNDPAQMFESLVKYCWEHKWIIPPYIDLNIIVGRCYQVAEAKLLTIIDSNLPTENRKDLLKLLSKTERNRSVLVEAKTVDQSLRTRSMQKNAHKLSEVKVLYFDNMKTIEALQLSDQAIAYYSGWIIKAKTRQIAQLRDPRKKCLYLLAFIKDQFCKRQDYALDGVLKAVRYALNRSKKAADDLISTERAAVAPILKAVVDSQLQAEKLAKEILEIIENASFSDQEKFVRIRNCAIFALSDENGDFADKVDLAARHLDKEVSKSHLYDALADRAPALIQKINGTLRLLVFDPENVRPELWDAIIALQNDRDLPLGFLERGEHTAVVRDGKIRKNLHKLLLFKHMVDAIKGGGLNLLHSFKHRSLQSYLIALETWQAKKTDFLSLAGLTQYENVEEHLLRLKDRLDETFSSVNERFINGENAYLKMRPDGRFRVKTPAQDSSTQQYISSQLADEGSVPVLQILREIDLSYPFVDLLSHHSHRNAMLSANPQTAFAGLMALGCNVGPYRMARQSVGITSDGLADMVDWRFSVENLKKVNRHLVEIINKLPLPNIYRVQDNQIHSSSDGKKVTVAVDSLLANYSFKYYGRDKGVSVYSFVDQKQSLFYSTVFSASDREAIYVLDGLLNNNTDISRIHSTDTHGYTEAVFGLTHLMGISFAPRFKGIEKQTIYGTTGKEYYKREGYRVLPSRPVNRKLIAENWDEILRFMATIKLGYTAASQLFKRLNSYSKDHALYKALKELGRIIKSQYILTYYDDLELRQRVQKQLNIVELSNKFHDAVFWDRGHQFHVGTKEEQEKYTLCRTVLQNTVILWNYLTLSSKVLEVDDPDGKQEMMEQISQGSVLSWAHVNFTGMFDFSQPVSGRTPFPIKQIEGMKISDN